MTIQRITRYAVLAMAGGAIAAAAWLGHSPTSSVIATLSTDAPTTTPTPLTTLAPPTTISAPPALSAPPAPPLP